MTKIYCGNLPFSANEDDVRGLFEEYGAVQSVELIYDRESGRPRGFGFVEMSSADAQAAIGALDGVSYGERNLRVNEARPREDNRGGDRGRRDSYGSDRRRQGSSGGRRY